MAHSHRALELIIQSAQNLSNVHHFAQFRGLKPYALVSIRDNNDNICSSPSLEERTSVQEGSDPTWNLRVTFYIDLTKVEQNGLALVVRLKSNRSSDKDIGVVRVPIAELLGGFSGAERQMNKSVVNSDGTSQQEQGTLKFSYKFGNTVQHPPVSTVNIGKNAPPAVQQEPGMANAVTDQVVSVGFGATASAGLGAVGTDHGANQLGDDSSGADLSAFDSSGADYSANYSDDADSDG